MGNYLIPANTKKSLLIFGIFNQFDLILFGCGVGVSILLLLTLPIQNIVISILAILPGLVTGMLIMPIPNYHNILTVLRNCIEFYSENQKFVWRGWCVLDATADKKK